MERSGRRLAAILADDLCGYSRLMESDVAGTLEHLQRPRSEVIEPAMRQFGGNLVGSAGDSLLLEFASAVDAVECAAAIQRGMSAADPELPHDRRMEFRIGINLGDVIGADGTLYGDGVNVAARIETLAGPGEVWITQNVLDQITSKTGMRFRDTGEHKLKNLSRPCGPTAWKPMRRLPIPTSEHRVGPAGRN